MNALFGLVVAGGRSRRMGRPKELMAYRGIVEPVRLYRLLEKLTDASFYSIRTDQQTMVPFAGGRTIVDVHQDAGPLGALVSAYRAVPGVSWLLVPVDMPLLERNDLVRLIESRGPDRDIVAYAGGRAGFEPFPAIYEASLSNAAEDRLRDDRRAIVGLGDGARTAFLVPDDRTRLTNVNTAQDRKRIARILPV